MDATGGLADIQGGITILSGAGTENSGTVNPLHPLEALRELPHFCFSGISQPARGPAWWQHQPALQA